MVEELIKIDKVVNVKFRTEKEKKIQAKFKAKCAILGENMQNRIINLISADVEKN